MSEETRRRVRESADRLQYVPSEAGRALSSGRTRRIGLVVGDLADTGYTRLLAPLHLELEALGYQLALYSESLAGERVVDRLVANGLDGVILATAMTESTVASRLRDRGVPFVCLNPDVLLAGADATIVACAPGFDTAVFRARELGHRRIGAVFGLHDAADAQPRELALRSALAAVDIHLDPAWVRRNASDTVSGDEATTSILASATSPTLIFCADDAVAFGALNAARRAGVAVPGGISIIGFGDQPAASWPIIQLSTISYDFASMARAAARLTARRIEQPDQHIEQIEFGTTFIDRGTLGECPAG